MQESSTTHDRKARRRGRTIALTVFYSLVVLFTGTAAANISLQVYSAGEAWPGDCRSGLRRLAASLEQAQRASEDADLDPEEALRRFRKVLAPPWQARSSIEQRCRASGEREAFDAVERLRYAEENAVRREGHDLVPLRRRVRGLLGGSLGEAPP